MSVATHSIDLTAVAAYPTDPQFVVPFQPKETTFINTSPDRGAYISYDGVNDHIYVPPAGTALGTGRYVSRQQVQSIWYKQAGASATLTVYTNAERY